VDENGNVITYTVEEVWSHPDWYAHYDPVIRVNGNPPTYTTSVTNRYIPGIGGPQLPSTGSAARLMFILCGFGIMLGSLVYGFGTRRKRERRMK
jgi:LPXTG-motif cell wall-anchored protein